MNRLISSSLILMVFLLLSCQNNLKHWVDYEPDTDFAMYSTYAIDEQCSDYNPGVNPIHQQRIKNAIEIELRDMGYKKSEDPDLVIKFFVKNETKFFYEQCLSFYDGYQGGRQCIQRAYDYEVGTLMIDLIDVRYNKAVWHGGGEGASWEKMKNPEKKIKQMVKAIMTDYKKLAKSEVYAHAR